MGRLCCSDGQGRYDLGRDQCDSAGYGGGRQRYDSAAGDRNCRAGDHLDHGARVEFYPYYWTGGRGRASAVHGETVTMGYYFTGGLGTVTPGQIGGSAQGTAAAVADFSAGASGGGGADYVKGTGAALIAASPFIPVAGAFIALAGVALELLGQMGVGSGCGQSCVLDRKSTR